MENSRQSLMQKIEELATLEINSLKSQQETQDSYSEYNKFLDWTIEKQIDEYKMFSINIHDSQLSVVRNYLWLSAMLIGADCSLIHYMNFSLSNMSKLNAVLGPMILLATFFALRVFVSGTQLLLGENGGAIPNISDSYLSNLKLAYGPDESNKAIITKYKLTSELQQSIFCLRSATTKKGLKIRQLNSGLVRSTYITCAIAILYYLFR